MKNKAIVSLLCVVLALCIAGCAKKPAGLPGHSNPLDPLFHGYTGESALKWRYQTGGAVSSSPAIGSDCTIYVGSNDGYLYALYNNPINPLKWRYQIGAQVNSSPAIGFDGTVFVGSTDGYLYAINPGGTLKWRYQTLYSGETSSPAIGSDGTIYVGSSYGLYAINPDGTLKWQCLTNYVGDIGSPVIGSDGTIYVGSSYGYLYAIYPDSIWKWRYQIGGDVGESSPAIGSDGTIYVGTSNTLYAINPDSSTLRWSYQIGSGGGYWSPSPAIGSDGTIYVGGANTNNNTYLIYAINPNGNLRWSYRTGSGKGTNSSPAIGSDGTIYFGAYVDDERGTPPYLYALKPDGTTFEWRTPLCQEHEGGEVRSSPMIGSDGTVYIGVSNGYLYAIQGTGSLANSPWPCFGHDQRHSGRVGGP